MAIYPIIDCMSIPARKHRAGRLRRIDSRAGTSPGIVGKRRGRGKPESAATVDFPRIDR